MAGRKSRMLIVAAVIAAGLVALLWPEVSLSKPDRRKRLIGRKTSFVEFGLQAGKPQYIRTGDKGDSVSIEGFSRLQSPGNPELPGRIYNVLLPPEADISSVKVQVTRRKSKGIDKKLDIKPCPPYAVQRPGRKGRAAEAQSDGHIWGKGKRIHNGRNVLVYRRNSDYPGNAVELVTAGEHGELKYARVRFMPVQYNPVAKKLTLNSAVTCRIVFDTGDETKVSGRALESLSEGKASKLYINSKEAQEWYEPVSEQSGGEPVPNAGDNSGYLIVTTDAIDDSGALDDFIAHKQGEGWTVTVLTETLPATGYGSATGQNRSDNIRTWLQDNYISYNLKYVLLVGDPRISGSGVPMKQTYPQGISYDPDPPGATDYWPKWIPTDYYYADLTGDWDLDGDGTYGEYDGDSGTGGVDFMPEVYVGRIPVYGEDTNWATTLAGIMAKIISYQSAGVLDRAWRRSILLPESFSDEDTDGAYLGQELVDNCLTTNDFSYYRMYQQGNYDSGYDSLVDSSFDIPTDCEQEMLAGDTSYSDSVISRWADSSTEYGIVQWWGHGNQKGAYAGFTGHQDPRNSGAFIYSSWVSALDDTKPAFTMQISCTNADPDDTDNLAYSLLKHGAIATLAGTNVTYYWVGQQNFDGTASNSGMGYEYIERLVADTSCGEAYYDGVAGLDSGSAHNWWNFMGFNVYGDPSCAPNYAPLLTITTESLESCEVGANYSAFLQADYGTEPYTWALASGSSLPPGLSLETGTGEIWGVPTTAGTYEFTVEVTDSAAEQGMAQKTLTLQVLDINASLPVPVLTGAGISTTTIRWSWDELAGDFDNYVIHNGDHSIVHTLALGTTHLLEGGFGPNTPVTRHMHTIGSTSSILFSDNFNSSTGWSLDGGEDVEDQSGSGGARGGYLVKSTQYVAQSFVSGMSGTLTKADVRVKKSATTINNLIVEIRPNVLSQGENIPGNTVLGSDSISISEISSLNYETVAAGFNIPSINSGTRYWIVLKSTDIEGYAWLYGNNLYSGGNVTYSAGSDTGPWSQISNTDCFFTTYIAGTGWEIGSAAAGGGSEAGNPDPGTDHTDTGDNGLLGYVIGGDYTDDLAERLAVSPVVDFGGYTRATLNFWRWLNVEKGIYDHAHIRVSSDGGSSWTTYWSNPDNDDVTDSSWQEVEIPITTTAAGKSNVQLAFVMGSTDGGLYFSGWNIDDVELTGIIDEYSESSNIAVVYTLAAVPGGISFSSVDYGSVKLDWTTNGNPEGTVYEVERSVTGGGVDFESVYLGTDTTCTDTWLDQNTTYYYRIRAYNGDDIPTAYTVEYSETTLAWSTPEELPVDAGALDPNKSRIVVDADGTVHCVWQQTDSESPHLSNIYYSYLVDGGSWSTPELLSTSNPEGDYGTIDHPHVTLDSGGDLHVAWGGYGSNDTWQVWYRKRASGTWLDPVEVTTGTDESYWPDIAVDSTGRVHIAYVTYLSSSSAEEIYYTYSDDGTSWSGPVSVSESPDKCSWGPSITLDDLGVLHIAWSEEISDFWIQDIFYRNLNSSTWSATVNLSSNLYLSRSPDIVTGADGKIMVVWDDGYSYPSYCYYDGSSWGLATMVCDSLPYSGLNMTVAYNNGVFYAAWSQRTSISPSNYEIWFSSFGSGLAWSSPVNLSMSGASCWLGSTGGAMYIDGLGDIHVVFDEFSDGKLWYTNNK